MSRTLTYSGFLTLNDERVYAHATAVFHAGSDAEDAFLEAITVHDDEGRDLTNTLDEVSQETVRDFLLALGEAA